MENKNKNDSNEDKENEQNDDLNHCLINDKGKLKK